jgi:hypothetical protein
MVTSLAIAMGLQGSAATYDHSDVMASIIEKKMDRWKPGKKDRLTPPSANWVLKGDLTGKWSTKSRMEWSTLALTSIGSNTYSVAFQTGGCLARWKLSRRATFKDGTLSFNRPIEEYAPATYDRAYLVRLGGKLRLISPGGLSSFELVSKDPKSAAFAK